MDLSKLKAIDVHVHAEVSCHDPEDPIMAKFFDAASELFQGGPQAPDHPRDDRPLSRAPDRLRHVHRRHGERRSGSSASPMRRSPKSPRDNSDIMIAFASIDPHKGKMGAIEARRLIEDYGVKGFKFHPPMQDFHPGDPDGLAALRGDRRLQAAGLIFHTGHSGMGTGMKGGGGMRLKYGQPMLVDDVAVDFPDMKIILAHPSWPWIDESLSMALHKENVFIDLSGWSPKYFPKQVIQYANTQLKQKMLFGIGLPADHARQMDGGRRGGGLPRRGDAADPQGECGRAAGAEVTDFQAAISSSPAPRPASAARPRTCWSGTGRGSP